MCITNVERPTHETWRDFPDILTDSLWLFDKRDSSGAHDNRFHGNFIPQIPNQLIRRFTSPGDVVLDPFLGSGTTLIEAKKLGRNGIGIELNKELAEESNICINVQPTEHNVWHRVIVGDSVDTQAIRKVQFTLNCFQHDHIQLAILHPPYHNAIKFSDHPDDLSNEPTLWGFLRKMIHLSHYIYPLLADEGFLALVMGDNYKDKEWIPLAFRTAMAIQEPGYKLKSIVVKNIAGNRAKEGKGNLWRYRAIKDDFYVFKHEYIFLFQK